MRTPVTNRRAQLLAMLRRQAFPPQDTLGTNSSLRGWNAAVEYRPGYSIRPAWTHMPEQMQNALAASSLRCDSGKSNLLSKQRC